MTASCRGAEQRSTTRSEHESSQLCQQPIIQRNNNSTAIHHRCQCYCYTSHQPTAAARSRNPHSFGLWLLVLVVSALLLVVLVHGYSRIGKTSRARQPAFSPPLPIEMKAWTCHGRNQKEMVDKLVSAKIIQSPLVREALLRVDRQHYVLQKDSAYTDAPQPIGYGATISAPHMHAHVLEEMIPRLVDIYATRPVKVLDVGCGSGYLTATLGRLLQQLPRQQQQPQPQRPSLQPTDTDAASTSSSSSSLGQVWGLDVVPELVEFSRTNIAKVDGDLLSSSSSLSCNDEPQAPKTENFPLISLQVGDGWKGLPEEAPFDAIHVGAAAATLPENLMKQLAVGGVLICPVGPEGGYQQLLKIVKVVEDENETKNASMETPLDKSHFSITALLGVRYVPLVRTN